MTGAAPSTPDSDPRGWRAFLHRHGAFLALAALHQLLFLLVLRRDPPGMTDTWDCVVGAMATDSLAGFSFSVLDAWDGVIGGMELRALMGAPLYALFGVTPWTLRLSAALVALLTGLVIYRVGWRIGGRLAGTLAAAAVLFGPPQLFFASLSAGNFHSSEVLFEGVALLMLLWAVSAERAGGLRHPALWALGWGLWLGFAVFHCFASLIFLPALWLVAWSCLRHRTGLKGIALHALGVVLGLLPSWWKVLLHTPYGVAGAARPKTPGEATSMSFDLHELVELGPGGGFAQALHFETALDTPAGSPLASLLAWGVTIVLFGGALALVVRLAPSLWALALGAIPGKRVEAGRVHPAVLPGLMVVLFGVAFVLSDMRLDPLPWYLSNVREHDHVAIVPWIAWLCVCVALLAGSLLDERRRGRARGGELALPPGLGRIAAPVAAVAVAWIAGTGMAAMTSVATGPTTGHDGPSTRSACWDVPGFFMANYLGEDEAAIDAGCRRYGDPAWLECRRGAAWSRGFASTGGLLEREPGSWRPSELAASCRELAPPFELECLRGVGWALRSDGEGDVATDEGMVRLCDALERPAEQRACWLGVGFPLGDHLGTSPDRFRRALQDLPADRRDWIVEGAGALVGRSVQHPEAMRAVCASWGPELTRACERGAADSLAWRTPDGDGPTRLDGLPGPYDCRLETTPAPAVAGEPMAVRLQLTPRDDAHSGPGRLVVGLPPALHHLRDELGRPLQPGSDLAVVVAGTERHPMAIRDAPASDRWYYELDFGSLPAGRPVTIEVQGLWAPEVPTEQLDFVVRVARAGDPGFVDVCPPRPFEMTGAEEAPTLALPPGEGPTPTLVLFGGRTTLTSGLLTPQQAWARARSTGVQVVALADPGWMLSSRELEELLDAADAANEPGVFVALPALELEDRRLLVVSDPELLRGALAGQGGSRDLQEVEDFGEQPARFVPDLITLAQEPGVVLFAPDAVMVLPAVELTRAEVVEGLVQGLREGQR